MTASHRFDEAMQHVVRNHVASFDRTPTGGDGLRRAAVAVTIAGDDDGRACFVITRRAATLKHHAGQWALPGGRLDAEELPEAAALRELAEEVGFPRDPSHVLGLLDDYPTRSGFLITPVVVWGETSPAFATDESEVASVHLVPLDELERPDVPRLIDGEDPTRPVIQLPLYGRYVHAPTAAILYQFREVGLHGRATRVAHFDQPRFAWS